MGNTLAIQPPLVARRVPRTRGNGPGGSTEYRIYPYPSFDGIIVMKQRVMKTCMLSTTCVKVCFSPHTSSLISAISPHPRVIETSDVGVLLFYSFRDGYASWQDHWSGARTSWPASLIAVECPYQVLRVLHQRCM